VQAADILVAMGLHRDAEDYFWDCQACRMALFNAEEMPKGANKPFRDSADALFALIVDRAKNAWMLKQHVRSPLLLETCEHQVLTCNQTKNLRS
jgi:hypothetical protein